jgi:uncharacterized protein
LSFYLDTSVVVPLFVNEVHSTIANDWLQADERALFFSNLVVGELNSALSRLVRNNEITKDEAAAIRSSAINWLEIAATLVEHLDLDIEVAAAMVVAPFPKLLMPDAIHIATCQRLGLKFVTLDQDLLTIAAREGVAAIAPA